MSGNFKIGNFTNACLSVWNAFSCTSCHRTVLGCPFFVRSVSDNAIQSKFGINFLWKPTKPRNYLTCFFVTGLWTSVNNFTLSGCGFSLSSPKECPMHSKVAYPIEHLLGLAVRFASRSLSSNSRNTCQCFYMYIVAVCFIGGETRSIRRRKPPTHRKPHICYVWWTCFSTDIRHTYMDTNCATLIADLLFHNSYETSYRGFSRKTKRN